MVELALFADAAEGSWFILVAMGLMLLFILAAFLIFYTTIFKFWLQAFLSGRGVSILQLVGMTMRRVNSRTVIEQGIASTQAGHPVEWRALESAYLQGVDLPKVVTAYCVARKKGQDFSFEELVEAERESRLKELLD